MKWRLLSIGMSLWATAAVHGATPASPVASSPLASVSPLAPVSPVTPASPVVQGAPSDALEDVMRSLAARRHGEVSFVEQQFLSILKRPVESYGVLRYDAPSRLEKRTIGPRPETLLVEGSAVTVQRGRRSRALDLKAYPQIVPLIESIRATLAGDRSALQSLFRLEFAGDENRWTLVLKPLNAELAKTLAQIRIDGARDQLLDVEIRQADGDRSLMTLRPH